MRNKALRSTTRTHGPGFRTHRMSVLEIIRRTVVSAQRATVAVIRQAAATTATTTISTNTTDRLGRRMAITTITAAGTRIEDLLTVRAIGK